MTTKSTREEEIKKLTEDLKKMSFNRSKPTSSGFEPGTVRRYRPWLLRK